MKELIKKNIPSFLLDSYHYLLALMGAFLYGFPSRLRQGYGGQAKKLTAIGITGTSGKSTVVELTSKILGEAGFNVASLSSIKFKIGNKEWENKLKMTMPGRMKIQRFLRQAVNAGCKYAVLEVTSEGIKQNRHRFINFDVAVFTNLTPEHIESHRGFKKYREAKLELFKGTKNIHVINLDDENSKHFLEISAQRKILFSLKKEIDSREIKVIRAEDIKEEISGLKFKVKNVEFNLNLLGRFNVYNALATICVGLSQGISLQTCKTALEKVKGIPGRMEIVVKEPFTVIVDYAHTPDALEKVYKNVSGFRSQDSRLICVLGSCGGGRDKWKRPVLGRIAAKYCKEIIITNEDPYDEEPMEIIEQVAKGAGGRAKKILDRREAIRQGLKKAEPGDIVIITGKGSEPWMCVAKGKRVPWDDREIVREELKKIYEKI